MICDNDGDNRDMGSNANQAEEVSRVIKAIAITVGVIVAMAILALLFLQMIDGGEVPALGN